MKGKLMFILPRHVGSQKPNDSAVYLGTLTFIASGCKQASTCTIFDAI